LIQCKPGLIYQKMFVELFKSLAPGRAAGGVFINTTGEARQQM